MICSISGLILSILDYELDLCENGFKGLGLVPDDGTDTTQIEEQAVHDRINSKWTTTIRIINCISSILTITMLVLRNYIKVEWTNKYFNEQLKREKMQVDTIHFCAVETKDGGHDHNALFIDIQNRAFFTKKFIIEVFVQLIFPWPYFDCIIFMP